MLFGTAAAMVVLFAIIVLIAVNQVNNELDKQVDAFKLEFQTGEGKPLISAGREEFEEIAPEDITQEQIVKGRR